MIKTILNPDFDLIEYFEMSLEVEMELLENYLLNG